jgi:hypothetical protein
VIAAILVDDSRGVLRGQVGQVDIYEGARVYGFRVVPGRFFIIFVRLRASRLDCKMAGVLRISQFRSPSSTNSEDKCGAINEYIVSRAQLEAHTICYCCFFFSFIF